MTNEQLLIEWDAGNPITSVSMGGMGDDYEMAIQLTGMEWLRLLLWQKPDLAATPDEKMRLMFERFDKIITELIKPLGVQDNYGLSGAQWGAARNLGCVFYRQGYEEGLKNAGENRHITVAKHPFEPREP